MPIMLISVIFITVSCIPQLVFGFSSISAILTIGLLTIYIKWSALLSRSVVRALLIMLIPFGSALVAYEGNVWVALIYVLQLASISMVFSVGFTRHSSFATLMIIASLLRLSFQIGGTLLAPHLFGVNPMNIDAVLSGLSSLYGGEVVGISTDFSDVFLLMYPCLLIISQIVFCYIALWFAAYMQKGVVMPRSIPCFCFIRVEREFSVSILGILLFTILLRGASVVTINMLMILLFFYGVAGFSFIDYELRKRSIRGFVRVLLYIFIIAIEVIVSIFLKSTYLLTIIALLGISDSFLNFREVNMGGN